jgi:hypothetical protein
VSSAFRHRLFNFDRYHILFSSSHHIKFTKRSYRRFVSDSHSSSAPQSSKRAAYHSEIAEVPGESLSRLSNYFFTVELTFPSQKPFYFLPKKRIQYKQLSAMSGENSRTSSNGAVQTINSVGMGRLHGKNAIVTGAAG